MKDKALELAEQIYKMGREDGIQLVYAHTEVCLLNIRVKLKEQMDKIQDNADLKELYGALNEIYKHVGG